VKEDLLHFVWRLGRFDLKNLRTTEGAPIVLLKPGHLNPNAGPDFLEARIQIGGTTWAGSVEMHLRSSDWYRHQHQEDPAYRPVILHVVLEEDEPVFHSDGSRIPCLELKNRIEPELYRTYQRLQSKSNWVPCQPQFVRVDPSKRKLWVESLAIERMQEKYESLKPILDHCKGDWEYAFFVTLAQYLGGHVNKGPMQDLAKSLPYSLIRKHRHRLLQLEALFFGQSGLMPSGLEDKYVAELTKEYRYLQKLYRLTPMKKVEWKFLRMRPANFPTIRVAQLATLLHCTEHLFSKILAAANAKELEHLFDLEVSQYWKNHYRFGKPSAPRNKRLGRSTIHMLAINAVAPFLFHYGEARHRPDLQEKALELWEEIPPERNKVVQQWAQLGQESRNALQTQGLLQLKKRYCDTGRCLDCRIGQTILASSAAASAQ